MSKTEEKVFEVADPIATELGFELVDIEYKKEGANWYLRVFIDKEGGIFIEDCEALSRKLDEKMGEEFLKEAYILEVSSPGLDRPLKRDSDFEKFKGKVIDIKLFKAVDGSKEYRGELLGLEDGKIKILTEDDKELSFEKSEAAVVRLAVLF